MPNETKKLTQQEAMLKAAHYCAYQERCHNEVRHKLSEWGLFGQDSDMILARLIEQNYLNEERFAKSFAGGKFRVKQWGRLKIRRELKIRGLSDYCIQMGMKEIEEDDYVETLHHLLTEKLKSLPQKNDLEKRQKAYQYAATKGYEADLIWEVLKKK